MQTKETRPQPYTICTKNNSAWITDLHIRPETINSQEKSERKSNLTSVLATIFFMWPPRTQATKAKSASGTTPNWKASVQQKKQYKNENKMYRCEKKFSNHMSHKQLIPQDAYLKMYTAQKQKNKKKNIFPKTYRWPTGTQKMVHITTHQENANQTTMKCHLTPVSNAFMKEPRNNKCWQGCGGKREPLCSVCGNVSVGSHCWTE